MVSNVGIYAIANIFVMVVSIIQTFIMPKYLGVEDYGYWKLFGLYIGYACFLHFGYDDGVFMNWLGKKQETIRDEFVPQFTGLVVFQLIIVGICEILVGIWNLYPQTRFVLQSFFLQALFLNLLFITMDELIRTLKTEAISAKSKRRLKQIMSASLLTIDEVGFLPISRDEANLFFQLISNLYQNISVNLCFKKFA